MASYKLGVKLRKIYSQFVITILILSILFATGSWELQNAAAASLDHTIGNIDIIGLTDYGRICEEPVYWNGVTQTAAWSDGEPYQGLVFDHSLYDHSGGDFFIADWFDSYEREVFPDFKVTGQDKSLRFEENSPSQQKSVCSFTQVDSAGEIGVSYDTRVHQSVWTLSGKDWAIVEWRIENLMAVSLSQVNIGMEVYSTSANVNRGGADGDGADDLDFWDAQDDTYYVQDQTMATIGYASADVSNPLDHYYASETNFYDVDKDAYNALTGPDQLARDEAQFVLGDAIYSMVSWNDRTIPVNAQMAFAVVIACGADYTSLSSAISEAQDFWDSTRLKLTEVQDSPDTSERIEFYNSGSTSINLAGYYLSPDRGATRWDLSSLGTINSGSYEVYNLFSASDELGDEGGEIGLYSADNYLLNKLGYGTGGITPDPLSGESAALHINGVQYSDIWNRETSPTFGFQNTVQGAENSPKVVLNEVLFNPLSRETFIELKYIGLGVGLNLLGWKIVVDVEYTIGDVTLSPTFQFLVINSSMAPGLLATLTSSGDNVYLYNSTGEFVDMVGWSSEHMQDTSVMRVPEGEGSHDGYNDTSSVAAGWQFSSSPSMAMVSIGIDQEKAADLGGTMTFYLNISNAGPTQDVVDLNYTSIIEGLPGWWTIEFYYDDGSWTPLTDTDGDSLVDIGYLDSFDTITIIVSVTVPSSLPIGGVNEITIEVFSSVNPWAYDTTSLWAWAYPHIEALKSVYHNSIYLDGGGAFGFIPDETTLTIALKGLGGIPGTQISQDVIFCMDRSSSMGSSDPTGERKAGARYYTDLLSYPARAGVVEFNDTSRMLLGLSDDYDAVKAAINLIGQEGLTDMSLGLMLSIDELIDNGNYRHNRVIILLTDGMNNYPWQDDATLDQAQRAADEGILIFTIGLGDDADEALLQQVAAITGGIYYFSPTPDNLMAIFGYIAEELIVIAGEDPDPDITPLLTDVLPPYINYIPGSFVDPYTGDPMDPSDITVDGNGNTILEWNISQIAIGEIWAVSFNITASEIGLKETNVYGISSVNYTRYTDLNTTVFTNDSLPRVWINVLPIPPLPPTLYCNLTADKTHVWLNWTNPPTATDHYLIYRSEDKQGFDFSVPWKDTSSVINPITGIIDPLNRNWLDSGAALSSAPSQYYYCVRSVEASGNISTTSNTVGKWTKSFNAGVGTFSLPLKPFEFNEVDWFCDDIPNVNYIKWRDPATQTWVVHYKADGLGVNDTLVVLEEGYEIRLNAPTYYTFTGRPGTSIRYLEDCIPSPTGFALDVGPWAECVRSSNFGPSSDWSKSVALGDVNNDGIIDCVVGNNYDQNVVYLGDGKGNFNAFHYFDTGMGATASVALGDVNSDGDLDIVMGNQFNGMNGQNVVYLGDGDGTFDTTSYNFGTGSDATESIALGYIDSDSNLDIVCGNQFNMFDCQNVVYLGDGDGTFDTTWYNFGTGWDFTSAVALGYADSDSYLDIVVGNSGGQNVVYIGDGDGTFDTTSYNFGTGTDPTSSIALADLNSDTNIDIVVGNRYDGVNGQNIVYLGDGDGTFDTTSHNFGDGTDLTSSVALGDMNQDNVLDIVVGNEFDWIDDGQNFVYLGNGDGSFGAYYEFGSGVDATRDVVADDINDDGRHDIVCANNDYVNVAYFSTISYTVNLSWDSVSDPAFDRYIIYRTTTRDGLNLLSLPVHASTTNTQFTDMVYLNEGTQFYYMVTAVAAGDIIGYNSTYSIGVWFSEFSKGYESLGLPLEPFVSNNVDSYCDDIPNTVGMNYYIYNESRWCWHATRMPEGAYDPAVEMSEGYQLSTSDELRYAFVGI